MTERQQQIINRAASRAVQVNRKHRNSPLWIEECGSTEFFKKDYAEALEPGENQDLPGLCVALCSLGMESEALELTGLTEAQAINKLKKSAPVYYQTN